MKTINKLFGALTFSCLMVGMGACTDECDYTPAGAVDANASEVSFASEGGEFREFTPTDDKTLTITLQRTDASAEQTVGLIVSQNDGGIFQIPASATFAAGASTTTVEVTFPEAEPGVEYTYAIRLDVDPYRQDLITLYSGTVQVVQWDLIGTGTLTCSLLGGTASCNIYRASHAAWYKAEAPIEQGMDIVFKVQDNNSVVVEDQAIFTDANYGTVYVNNEAEGGVYDPETNVIQAALYYYCSAGYFGTFVETLTLPAE